MVLYNSREQLVLSNRGELVLLDRSELCANYLPPRSNSAGFASHDITQAEKYFLEYIDTCSDRDLHDFVRQRVEKRKALDEI